jgi:hypothetical protein
MVNISENTINQKADVRAASPAVQAGSGDGVSGVIALIFGLDEVDPEWVGAGSPSGRNPMSSGLRRINKNRGITNTRENVPKYR